MGSQILTTTRAKNITHTSNVNVDWVFGDIVLCNISLGHQCFLLNWIFALLWMPEILKENAPANQQLLNKGPRTQ